jgi:hypothetical protein
MDSERNLTKKRNLLGLALGGAMLMTSLPSTAGVEGGSFDGTWHVRLVTQSGTCDSSYSQTVAIENGRVRPVGGAAAISGGVGSDGRVALTIAQSVATADAQGRLRSKAGSGSWNLPMLGCTGSWTARRA